MSNSEPNSNRLPGPRQDPSQIPRRARRSAPALPAATSLDVLLQQLGAQDFELLLLGDASGSAWDDPCGWACVLIDRYQVERRLFYGAVSAASINLGEILPYLHALTWYHETHGRDVKPRRVYIVTDSRYVADGGNKAVDCRQPLPRTHVAMWAAFREFARLGYQITFRWKERNTNLFNTACDLVSSLSRTAVKHARDRLLTPEDFAELQQLRLRLIQEPQTPTTAALQRLLPKLLSGLSLADSAAAALCEELQNRAVPALPLASLHPSTQTERLQ